MFKKAIAGAATVLVSVLGLHGVASAHTASATPTCEGLRVSVSLYPNNVRTRIVVDGIDQGTNIGNFSQRINWDQSRDHTYVVTVDNQGTSDFDQTFNGSSTACVTTTTSPPDTVPTSTTPQTTETSWPSQSSTPSSSVPEDTSSSTSTPPTSSPESTDVPPPSNSGTPSTPSTPEPTGSSAPPSSDSSTPRATPSPTSPAPGSLPATGYGTGPLAAAGTVALMAGAGMLLAARRRSA